MFGLCDTPKDLVSQSDAAVGTTKQNRQSEQRPTLCVLWTDGVRETDRDRKLRVRESERQGRERKVGSQRQIEGETVGREILK